MSAPPPPPYQYIILHRSCLNHPGVLACQAAHAAGEAVLDVPAPSDTRVVALMAETAADLEALSVSLRVAGLHHVVIREPDEPYKGSATALGTRIIEEHERAKYKPLFANFKLLRPALPLPPTPSPSPSGSRAGETPAEGSIR